MPVRVGHRGHELRRLVRVTGVEHGGSVDRTQRRDVLERHLRRAVLADRDARVRAAERERRAADRRHAHEVVRAREECGERRRERSPAHGLEADGGSDELLLGDVHLEVALGVRFREGLGERRVRDLAVERDDVGASGAERCERVAVGLARRDLGAELVARELERAGGWSCGSGRFGLRDLDANVREAAELGDRCVGIVERLAVVAVLVLHGRDALALHRACDENRRPSRSWRRPDRTRRRSRRDRARRARSRSIRTPPRARRRCRDPTRPSSRHAGRAG